MKISNEELRVLQENELRKTKQANRQGGEFGEVFARQLDQVRTPGASTTSMGSGIAAAQASLSLSAPAEGASSSGFVPAEQAATRMDGMFSTFERYAEQIATGETGSLRNAYSLLQGVSQDIAGFKAEFPNAGEEMPELAALLNELDVLTTTETFKFNRGDYL